MNFQDTINWYNANARQYVDKAYEQMSVDSVEWFLSHLGESPRVLDAGCGPGKHSRLLYERGANVMGLDISKGMIAEAARRNPNIEFIEGTFLELPFPDGSFAGVFATASLVHLETVTEVEQSLAEFARVLQPNGILFVKVKLQIGDNETESVSDSLSGHERFFRYYTQDSLCSLLQNASFAIIEERFAEDKFDRPEVKWIEVVARKVG